MHHVGMYPTSLVFLLQVVDASPTDDSTLQALTIYFREIHECKLLIKLSLETVSLSCKRTVYFIMLVCMSIVAIL